MTSPMSKLFLVSFALLGLLFQLVAGLPTAELEKRDIWSPPVLYPHDGTIWYKGQTHNVTWDISNPPANLSDPTGTILLRQGNNAAWLILADGFDIRTGRVEVTVPWVLQRDDYSVMLLGDSGNVGQAFTILQ